jgi:hypothetical protein
VRLGANRMRLAALTQALLVKWGETRDTWRDDRAEQFERTYVVELASGVENSLGVVEKLDELLTQLRSDCE